MLIYIHVPFCRRKCHYCAFYSVKHSPEAEAVYLKALAKELELRAEYAGTAKVYSLYMGGGTPTILSAEALEWLFNQVHAHFRPATGLEVTMEVNPETVTSRDLPARLLSMGVNRISLGVQSFENGLLSMAGRRHTAEQAVKSAARFQEAGLDNLSLDLIWGLPGQTRKMWLDDLRKAVRMGPRHISCYGLSLEPETVLHSQVQNRVLELPREKEQALMYLEGAEYLESRGFLQYEISSFASLGYACLHNQGYWQGRDYLGLGPSGVSCVNMVRWRNPASIRDYGLAASRDFSGLELERLTKRDLSREKVMLSLRTTLGLNLREYREMTGQNFCSRFREMIKVLHQNGLVRMANGYFRLTRTGMLVSNSIIERLIA
ncbi:MAG: radical SAM family heme chaperone HemW [Desulfonatronovibrionaceae bacterium]